MASIRSLIIVLKVCNGLPVYTSLCRILEYLLKTQHFIQNYSSVASFLIFETILLGRSLTLLYVWKKISQKWTAFVFGSIYLYQTFTKYMSNQYTYFHILTYPMWLQVMERLLILLCFWVFSYVFDAIELLCLHKTFTDCVSN